MRAIAVLIAIASLGCQHRPVYRPSTEIVGLIDRLERNERVQLRGSPLDRSTTVDVSVSDRVVYTDVPSRPYRRRTMRVPIGELIAECPGTAVFARTREVADRYPNCLLMRALPSDVQVGSTRHVDREVIGALVGLAAFGGVTACAFACDGPIQTVSQITAGAVVVGAIAAAVLVIGYARSHH